MPKRFPFPNIRRRPIRSWIVLSIALVALILVAGCGTPGSILKEGHTQTTAIIHLTDNPLVGYEYPAIDGNNIVWTWVHDDPNRGLTLYTIPTHNYTDIKGRPFGMSPPKISGDYIVWADSSECANNGLLLYQISSGDRKCICTNPTSPRKADISGNYVVWEDAKDIHLYDIRTGKESAILANSSYQENPSISGNRIVWSDYRNYNDGGFRKDIFLYNITDKTVSVINRIPELHTASPPYIHENYVIWSDQGQSLSSKVHLYNIATETDRILVNGSADIFRFSMSGDLLVWTSSEFRGNDIPDFNTHLYDLKTGSYTMVCSTGSNHQTAASISGNAVVFQDGMGIGLCTYEADPSKSTLAK